MSDNIFNNRFFGFKEGAWHNKGIVSQDETSACEAWGMLTPYWFEKRPVTVLLNGVQQEVKDYAIVRSPLPDDPQEVIMGYVAKNYNIVQPDEICGLFDANVRQPISTLGCLGKGEKLFLTWELPQISVDGDAVKTYGFVAGGFDGLYGVSLYLSTIRVVCQNTWMMAIQESERSSEKEKSARIYSGRHNSVNVGRDLGIWMSHVQERAEAKLNNASNIFNAMAKQAIEDNKTAQVLINAVYPYPNPIPEDYPDQLRQEKQERIDIAIEKADRDRSLAESLFGGQGIAIDATAWGLFNSITELENHQRVVRKDATQSILFGARAKTMTRAFNVISGWMTKNNGE